MVASAVRGRARGVHTCAGEVAARGAHTALEGKAALPGPITELVGIAILPLAACGVERARGDHDNWDGPGLEVGE